MGPSVSVRYCAQHYGAYGLFATYCLRTAVKATGVYTVGSFKRAFHRAGVHQRKDPKLMKFLELLRYEDSGYFSFSETHFLLQILECCAPRSDAQLDRDHREVTLEIERGENIWPSHAEALAKAIEYWKLRYNQRYEDWRQKWNEVTAAIQLREEMEELFGSETPEMYEDSGCEFCD